MMTEAGILHTPRMDDQDEPLHLFDRLTGQTSGIPPLCRGSGSFSGRSSDCSSSDEDDSHCSTAFVSLRKEKTLSTGDTSADATASRDNHDGMMVVQVKTVSGSAVLEPQHFSIGAGVRDVLELLPTPEGCRAILLLGQSVLHDEGMELAALMPGEDDRHQMTTLEFGVVWEPSLQKGEQVVVAQEFKPITNFHFKPAMLFTGQVGRIQKIHVDPGAFRASSGKERGTGDALVNFAGSNLWVSKRDLRKLRRL